MTDPDDDEVFATPLPSFSAWHARAHDIRHVVLHMREASAREAFASRPDNDRERLAAELCRLTLPDFFALGLFRPADGPWAGRYMAFALAGCAPVGADPDGGLVGTMLWLATDGWPAIALPSHRFWKRHFVPHVLSQYRRVEFLGGADPASQRWCRSAGFTAEGTAYRHGKSGEDFIRFAWTNPSWPADP